jgi:Putative Ig domain
MKRLCILGLLSTVLLVRTTMGFSAEGAGNAPSGIAVITNGLHLAYINATYTAVLSASGGAPPYSWSVSSGQLPPGLSLANASGRITGTPTQGGTYSLTVTAKDSTGNMASKSFTLVVFEQPLDAYSGFINLPCPNGPQPHFYTQKTGSRWHLCTPAGNAFWMSGVYSTGGMSDTGIDYQGIDLYSLILSKYAAGYTTSATFNWSLQAVRRMQSWGFNEIAEFEQDWTLPVAVDSVWKTADHTIPVKLPFSPLVYPALYSLTNSGNYASGPVKDIVYGIKSNVYTGYRSQSPDFWDANYVQWLQGALKQGSWPVQWTQGPHSDYLIGLVVDETDRLFGFGAGPDFPTTANGVINAGYQQPHLGWMVLVTAETQSSNSTWHVTYADTTVYSKQRLSQWLANRYAGNISALNAAWGSNYTTFGASGAGWGVGSGVLDEDGTCPAKKAGLTCWVPADPYTLSGATTAMEQDLDDFLLYHAEGYFSIVKSVLNAQVPGVLYLGPTVLGTWGAPPRRQILQAAAKYVDVFNLTTMPPNCAKCTDIQQRIDFIAQYGGDKPWTTFEGVTANADSYMSRYAKSTDQFKTQLARATYYSQMVQGLLSTKDTPTGTYHAVGFKWWELYDDRSLQLDYGLLTRRDDPYDGISATTKTGMDSWGYPTGCLTTYGCEQAAYGDFVDAVILANLNALRTIATGR